MHIDEGPIIGFDYPLQGHPYGCGHASGRPQSFLYFVSSIPPIREVVLI